MTGSYAISHHHLLRFHSLKPKKVLQSLTFHTQSPRLIQINLTQSSHLRLEASSHIVRLKRVPKILRQRSASPPRHGRVAPKVMRKRSRSSKNRLGEYVGNNSSSDSSDGDDLSTMLRDRLVSSFGDEEDEEMQDASFYFDDLIFSMPSSPSSNQREEMRKSPPLMQLSSDISNHSNSVNLVVQWKQRKLNVKAELDSPLEKLFNSLTSVFDRKLSDLRFTIPGGHEIYASNTPREAGFTAGGQILVQER